MIMKAPDVLNDFWRKQTFVSFDTETTGIWAPANRIVEIGAVKFRPNSDEVEEFEALVNPERPIPVEVQEIHGISNDMVQNADTIGPVLERFVDFIGDDSILIAHNALFDISFVSVEIDRTGINFPENPVLDTVELFRKYYPGLQSYSLLSISQELQVARTQMHRALDDARMVTDIFRLVLPRIPGVKSRAKLASRVGVYNIHSWKEDVGELPLEMRPLAAAVEGRTRVKITYQSRDSIPTDRVIRPSQLYRLGGTLYVNAYCETVQAERTFRLDRILAVAGLVV